MHHFGAPAEAEYRSNVSRRAATDFQRVLDIVGDQTAADFGTIGRTDNHRVAAGETAVDADDTRGKKTLPAAARLPHRHRWSECLSARVRRRSIFACRHRISLRSKPRAPSSLGDGTQRVLDVARGDDHKRVPALVAISRRLDLGLHAAARKFGSGAARHRLDLRRDAQVNATDVPRRGADVGRRVVEAIDIGQQYSGDRRSLWWRPAPRAGRCRHNGFRWSQPYRSR